MFRAGANRLFGGHDHRGNGEHGEYPRAGVESPGIGPSTYNELRSSRHSDRSSHSDRSDRSAGHVHYIHGSEASSSDDSEDERIPSDRIIQAISRAISLESKPSKPRLDQEESSSSEDEDLSRKIHLKIKRSSSLRSKMSSRAMSRYCELVGFSHRCPLDSVCPCDADACSFTSSARCRNTRRQRR